MDGMGIFRTTIDISSTVNPDRRASRAESSSRLGRSL